MVLVLDASGSMKENLRFLQEAATSFIHKLEEVDSALVVQFNDTIKGSAEFTDDTDRLDQFIEALQAWGGTSLYDAVHYGLGRVKDQPGRKAVVVFTDGADTTSRLGRAGGHRLRPRGGGHGLRHRLQGRAGRGAAPAASSRRSPPRPAGEFFAPSSVGDLIKIFGAISEELHNHYAFAYSPKRAPDGSWRTIQVKAGPQGRRGPGPQGVLRREARAGRRRSRPRL